MCFKTVNIKLTSMRTSANVSNNISDVESLESDVNLESDLDNGHSENLEKDIEPKLATVRLKLENIYPVSNAAVDKILQELNYLIGSLSVQITKNTINQILQGHGCQLNQSVVEKLASALSE